MTNVRLLSLLGNGIGLAFPSAVRIVNWTTLLISAAWIGISLYGIMFGWKRGHTHAMQFSIGGWSPSSWVYPEWGGLYEEDGRKLYVGTGISENIAFRFGAWP